MENKDKKSKRGRVANAPENLKKYHVGFYLSEVELSGIANWLGLERERSNGGPATLKTITQYLRAACGLPSKTAVANNEISIALAQTLANMNQIAQKAFENESINDMELLKIYEIKDILTTLQPKLLREQSHSKQ